MSVGVHWFVWRVGGSSESKTAWTGPGLETLVGELERQRTDVYFFVKGSGIGGKEKEKKEMRGKGIGKEMRRTLSRGDRPKAR